jgi:dCMP deaminase
MINDRISIDQMMMQTAFIVSQRATCNSKTKVGAVASQNGTILAIGYNGVPRGMKHCTETGCIRGADDKHLFLVHAEENVVASAVRQGICLTGAIVYVTHLPCSHCAALLVQAGISKVIYAIEYGDTQSASRFVFESCKVEVVQYEIAREITDKFIRF